MSALDELIEIVGEHLVELSSTARAELAQLRAAVEEWHTEADRRAKVGMRDKSALMKMTAERDTLQQRLAALETAVNEARKHIARMTDYCQYWLLAGNVMTGSNDGLILRDDVNTCRAWLAAHPAPEPDDDDDNQPALLTASGYFTSWPEEDASAPQTDERMFDE